MLNRPWPRSVTRPTSFVGGVTCSAIGYIKARTSSYLVSTRNSSDFTSCSKAEISQQLIKMLRLSIAMVLLLVAIATALPGPSVHGEYLFFFFIHPKSMSCMRLHDSHVKCQHWTKTFVRWLALFGFTLPVCDQKGCLGVGWWKLRFELEHVTMILWVYRETIERRAFLKRVTLSIVSQEPVSFLVGGAWTLQGRCPQHWKRF